MSDSKTAGQGLALITLAKLYFIVMGFVVQVGLPALLKPVEYGRYSLAMSFVSVIDNVLVAATVQSLSKRVSEAPALASARLRQGLLIQLLVGLCLSLGLMAAAPYLSGLGYSTELTPLLRVAALVPLFYALYAALVGSLNGRQQFRRQAQLDMTFSTLRTIGILGAAVLGLGALGSLAGFAGAAFCILGVALFAVGTGKRGENLPVRTWFEFLLPVVLFQIALNGMLLLDVWVLQNTAAELGIASGLAIKAAAEHATELVGFYRAGQNFAIVPYQLILSVTFIVFPLVSKAVAQGKLESARLHIKHALRFSLIVLFALAAPLGGAAEGVIRLAFPKYLAAAEAQSVLVFGQLALALFVIIATVLSSAGKPWITVIVGAIGLGCALFCNRLFVSWTGLSGHPLRAAATATTCGTSIALVLSALALRRVLSVSLPLATFVRCALAGAAAFAVARALPQSRFLSPLVLIASGLCYLALLVVLRELKKSDLDALLSAVSRRKMATSNKL
jgi:stage V sporulation protein B